MAHFYKCIIFLLAVQWLEIVRCKALLGGISLKRSFDIALKPIPLPPFKPLTFLKEKWTPFGKFGMKHVISKRNADKMLNDKKAIEIRSEDLSRVPAEVNEGFETQSTALVPYPIQPPLFLNEIIPPPTHVIGNSVQPPISGLHTDISRAVPVDTYLNSAETVGSRGPVVFPLEEKISPPLAVTNMDTEKAKTVKPIDDKDETPSSIIRGSRIALYFGNVLLQILSEFLSNSHSSFNKLSIPDLPTIP